MKFAPGARVYWIVLASLLILPGVTLSAATAVTVMPIVMVLAFVFKLTLLERGLYPFIAPGVLGSRKAFYAFQFVIVLILTGLFKEPPAPWLPYPSIYLYLVPVLIYLMCLHLRLKKF